MEAASSRKVGYGAGRRSGNGTVSPLESKARIEALIAKGEHEGASLLVDGRGRKVKDYEEGFFVFPTVLEGFPRRGKSPAPRSSARS